jgi:hypothetical protein
MEENCEFVISYGLLENASGICAPACRRRTNDFAEDHGEVALVRKTETVGHVGNGQSGFLEQTLSFFNS